jgi:hypothetical protein
MQHAAYEHACGHSRVVCTAMERAEKRIAMWHNPLFFWPPADPSQPYGRLFSVARSYHTDRRGCSPNHVLRLIVTATWPLRKATINAAIAQQQGFMHQMHAGAVPSTGVQQRAGDCVSSSSKKRAKSARPRAVNAAALGVGGSPIPQDGARLTRGIRPRSGTEAVAAFGQLALVALRQRRAQ